MEYEIEDDLFPHKTLLFQNGNSHRYEFHTNISPSKKSSTVGSAGGRRDKAITHSVSPRAHSHSPPDIFHFELVNQKCKGKRKNNKAVRIRAKLTIDDLLVETPDWAICSVCSEVFKQPVVTPECGHTYCMQCIELVCNSRSRECPLCRKQFPDELNVKDLSPNRQLLHVIDTMKVRCRWGMKLSDTGQWIHDPEGCLEITDWQSLFAHDEVCGFVTVPCPYKNCLMLVRRRDLENHQATCEERLVSCELCNMTYAFKNTNEHKRVCPQHKSPCPKGCGQLITNQNRRIHLQNECPELEVSCIYTDMGCIYKGKKKKVDEHVPSCVYHTLKPFILQTQKTITDLLQEQQKQSELIKDQQKEMHELRQIIEQQEQELKQLRIAKQMPSCPEPLPHSLQYSNSAPNDSKSSGGLWNRLYRFIDPRESRSSPVHSSQTSIHSF